MEFRTLLQQYQSRVEAILKKTLPNEPNNILHQAMQYAVLNGGKRLRPLLIYLAGTILDCPLGALDQPACAIELMHNYSLVHDDLPAMDNDDFRRGYPSCHKKFGETVAILAGDALQTLSFETLTKTQPLLTSSQQKEMICVLSKASGAYGMANGQTTDTTQRNLKTEKAFLTMYEGKTGRLIKASVELAIIAANCKNHSQITALIQFAECFGLAFQLHDDIHDSPETSSQNKNTYTSIIGLAKAREKCDQLQDKAIQYLQKIDEHHSSLTQLVHYIFSKSNT